MRKRLANLPQPLQPHLEIEIVRQQQLLQALELGDQLLLLVHRALEAQLGQRLLRLFHLVQDQLLAGVFEAQHQSRGVFRLELLESLGEPEHAIFQLRHFLVDLLLAEAELIGQCHFLIAPLTQAGGHLGFRVGLGVAGARATHPF